MTTNDVYDANCDCVGTPSTPVQQRQQCLHHGEFFDATASAARHAR
ncbi:MAG: hypothetical protein IPI41_11425 [Flavobacteriales bacterium]|nr:hypothetical protein [Flavobacteriales bacterium]